MRHHNPGTRYKPDPRLYRRHNKRVRMLSSIIVVPPRMRKWPTPPHKLNCRTQASNNQRRPLMTEIEEKWRRPRQYEVTPPKSAWTQVRSLVPVPKVNYKHGFQIVPGEAYQTVLWYENPQAEWPPQPIQVDESPRPKFYHASGVDPRSLDLRVHLEKLKIRDLREHLNTKRAAKGEASTEAPEEAVTRLHGEIWDPTKTTGPSIPEQTTLPTPERTDPPNWSGPPRRRRRCRLLIISKDEPRPTQ